jgi:uncharacterized protein (TIGR03435 family)
MGSVDSPDSSYFKAQNITAQFLIQRAYGVFGFDIRGGPAWITDALFNVEAKSDPSVDAEFHRLSAERAVLEKQHMIQVALQDRFHLLVHYETKDAPVFIITLSNEPPKLSQVQPQSSDSARLPPIQIHTRPQGIQIVGTNATIQMLAQRLVGPVGTTVIDDTGLTKGYSFTLQFSGNGGVGIEQDDASHWPSLSEALHTELGLKIVSAKRPTRYLHIDRIEMPSDN